MLKFLEPLVHADERLDGIADHVLERKCKPRCAAVDICDTCRHGESAFFLMAGVATSVEKAGRRFPGAPLFEGAKRNLSAVSAETTAKLVEDYMRGR